MSVSVLPASSALGSLASPTFPTSGSTMQNGAASRANDELSVAEIKDRAKVHAQKATRGASALHLIRAARSQLALAHTYERDGDLKDAYAAYIKSVALIQTFMDSVEFKAENRPGKHGVLFKEYQEYMQHEGRDLTQRVTAVENKLKELEKVAIQANGTNGSEESSDDQEDGPNVASGGSIADRMRALKNAGMSVNTTKRFSKELPRPPNFPPSTPATPMSPATRLSTRDSAQSLRGAASPLTATPAPPLSASIQSLIPLQPSAISSASSSSSIHAFVSPATLGGPSPTSSASSSPQTQQFALADFAQSFPSIDELEASSSWQAPRSSALSSVLATAAASPAVRPHLPPPLAASTSTSSMDDSVPSSGLTGRAFPVPPTHTGSSLSSLRRGSLATVGTGPLVAADGSGGSGASSPVSRPSSPWNPLRSPTSPSVPRKPSNLSLHASPAIAPASGPSSSPALPLALVSTASMGGAGGASGSSAAHMPNGVPASAVPSGVSTPYSAAATPPPDKVEFPVTNSVSARMLDEYLQNPALKVLLIDVRPRNEFERETIKHPGDAIVCLEPTVLMRETVTADTIEESLSAAPPIELALFSNRDKFDLVVMFDASSNAFGRQFQLIERAIYERAFRKMLKRMPVILVGGLEAWKAEFGEDGIVHGGLEDEPRRGRSGKNRDRAHTHSDRKSREPSRANGVLPTVPEAMSNRQRSQTESASSSAAPSPRLHSLSRAKAMRLPVPEQGAGPSRAPPPVGPKPLMQPMSPTTQFSQPPRPLPAEPVVAPLPQWSSASSSIQYPSFARSMSPSIPRSMSPVVGTSTFNAHAGLVSPPPQASINPSPLSRRRSDYVDQSQEALSGAGLGIRTPIDYPDLSSSLVRPPPAIAAPPSERQDMRPRIAAPVPSALNVPRAPTIQSDYPVHYWPDVPIGTSGLKNMGNTCYMNSTIQCLNATVPFTRFFLDGRWKGAVNMLNPIGTKGQLANAFAAILHDMWQGDQTYLTPTSFRRSIVQHGSQFEGTEQQDCQEFLSFLLGGLHEDLNRVLKKPNYTPSPEREAELERLPVQIASEQEWSIYRMRDDSLIVDFFQGQFRNRLQCLTCRNTSTTFNAFMYLTLPIPNKGSKVSIQQCLDLFVKAEVMEKADAWNCPHCKTLRRASKQLSLSRLPPVLLIHLKRFTSQAQGADKIETLVDFPLKGLDLTGYMPPSLPPGIDKGIPGAPQLSMDDPRVQSPPYKYDLYGVTNHFGNLTSGHYTAFIANRGGWLYCDDSRLTPADPKDVVGKPAYVLYYKRVKT